MKKQSFAAHVAKFVDENDGDPVSIEYIREKNRVVFTGYGLSSCHGYSVSTDIALCLDFSDKEISNLEKDDLYQIMQDVFDDICNKI